MTWLHLAICLRWPDHKLMKLNKKLNKVHLSTAQSHFKLENGNKISSIRIVSSVYTITICLGTWSHIISVK